MTKDELLKKYGPENKIQVLNHGHVALIDIMGDDARIEQAARLSYQKGTRKVSETKALIRYLMRHKHWTPFEKCVIELDIKLPIFIARQFVRHRTQCLAGDTVLHFDLPGGVRRRGSQLYPLTIAEVFEKWQEHPGERGGALLRRSRVAGMLLRGIDEATLKPRHTRITNCWASGVKALYEVRTVSGQVVRMSKDHRCFTDRGWLRLSEVMEAPETKLAVLAPRHKRAPHAMPTYTQEELIHEEWRSVADVLYATHYEVSSLGRVRSRVSTKGNTTREPVVKKLTPTPSGHLVVSLSNKGKSRAFQVHKLVLEAFVGPGQPGQQCCHNDYNGMNNRVSNLRWGTTQSNANDRVLSGSVPSLTCTFEAIECISPAGEEMTYDIEVEGPWHNFSANGVIVHNSLNELSGRYSELPEEFYVPQLEQICYQDKKNKQGRAEPVPEREARALRGQLTEEAKEAFVSYHQFLESGVARETARINLPLSTYTQWNSTMNLRNLFNFLSLRLDGHAQWEAVEYAKAIRNIVKDWVPLAYEAFEDYDLRSVQFSQQEQRALSSLLHASREDYQAAATEAGLTGREAEEWVKKMESISLTA